MLDQPARMTAVHEVGTRELIYATHGNAGRVLALGGLQHMGWNLRRAPDARSVLRILERNRQVPHAALLDLREGFSSQDLAEYGDALSARNAGWIAGVDAAQLADETVRRLIRDYCCDYVTLPCPADVLATVIGHVHGMTALACERPAITGGEAAGFDGMIGTSAPMQAVWDSVRKLAPADAPLLITGETGTGKSTLAESLHRHSARQGGRWIALNCSTSPADRIEAELSSVAPPARGDDPRVPPVKAGGGTLFLDQVDALPLPAQAGLLRYLRHTGNGSGRGPPPPDLRILAATDQDLEAATAAGGFRHDLAEQLGVLRLHLPPLRHRGGDIERLAEDALRRHAQPGTRTLKGFSACARHAMHTHPWPGNVRELINRVRHAIVVAEGRLVTASDLQLDDTASRPPPTLDEVRDAATRAALERALQRNRGRLIDTARELGVSRVTLYRLLGRHEMRSTRGHAARP